MRCDWPEEVMRIILLLVTSVHCQQGYDYSPPPSNVQLSLAQPLQNIGTDQGQGHSHGGSGDPLDWLRESVPGEPGLDYPILSTTENLGFSCAGRPAGLFADVESRCQAWHQCLGDTKWSFLCPNGTIFSQQVFSCVWWFDFDCGQADSLYSLNNNLYLNAVGNGDAFGGLVGSNLNKGQAGVGSLRKSVNNGIGGQFSGDLAGNIVNQGVKQLDGVVNSRPYRPSTDQVKKDLPGYQADESYGA